jgi:hypothetical protein
MKAIKLASTGPERERLKSKCIEVLARAEEIKRVEIWSGRVEQTEQWRSKILLRAPVSDRELSTREEVIVLEGSKLHGLTFPPWILEPSDQLFQSTTHENLYVYGLFSCVIKICILKIDIETSRSLKFLNRNRAILPVGEGHMRSLASVNYLKAIAKSK